MSGRLAILGLHKIGEPSDGSYPSWNYISTNRFAEFLTFLREDGWAGLSLAEFVEGLSAPDRLPPKSVLITFDDGYRSTLTTALPVLRRFGMPGVVFVPTDFVGGMNTFDRDVEPEEEMCSWEELLELQASGVAVQAHGVTHSPLSTLDADGLRRELVESKRLLEAGLGSSVDVFAYPYGDAGHPLLTPELMSGAGYRAACLYGGGAIWLQNGFPLPYSLPRLALGPDSDLRAMMSAGSPAGF